eukprot:3712512-Pleurochrysis_carterae.AAC.3
MTGTRSRAKLFALHIAPRASSNVAEIAVELGHRSLFVQDRLSSKCRWCGRMSASIDVNRRVANERCDETKLKQIMHGA